MTDDEKLVRQLIQKTEDAWNRGDSASYAAPFAEDAEFVDILGEYHKGRAVIQASYRLLFDTIYKGSRKQIIIESVRFIRPDVAAVFASTRLLCKLLGAADDPHRLVHTGDEMSEVLARPTLVCAKDNGTWRIVAYQNTGIAAARPTNIFQLRKPVDAMRGLDRAGVDIRGGKEDE